MMMLTLLWAGLLVGACFTTGTVSLALAIAGLMVGVANLLAWYARRPDVAGTKG